LFKVFFALRERGRDGLVGAHRFTTKPVKKRVKRNHSFYSPHWSQKRKGREGKIVYEKILFLWLKMRGCDEQIGWGKGVEGV